MHHPYQDTEDFVFAHLNKDELNNLAQLNGGIEYIPGTKTPTFQRLKQIMEHPHVKNGLMEWERQRFAGGGEVDGLNDFMRQAGRYGDTEFVQLPRSLADLFDRALTGGQPSINRTTGKRQYFLGGLFNGLKSILSPISNALSPIAKTIAPIAGTALTHFAPMIGNMAGKAFGGAAADLGAGPLGTELGNMAGSTVGDMASNFGQYLQGSHNTSPQDQLRQGIGTFARQASPMVGNQVSQMAHNYSGGIQNPYLAAALNHGSNLAGNYISSIGTEGANALMENRSPQFGRTAGNVTRSYLDSMENPIASATSNAIGNYMNSPGMA
jgi:hypothetical protein